MHMGRLSFQRLVVTAHDGTLIAFVIPKYFPPGTGGAG
jgi:hypothetical protein